MDIVIPNEHVKTYAPWSISKSDTAKQCPRLFQHRYVQKPKPKYVPNSDALVGQAAHSALEFALTGRPVPAAINFAIDKFELCTEEIGRVQDMQDSMESFISKFFGYLNKHQVHRASLLIEKRLAVGFDHELLKFFNNNGLIRGVLDVGVLFTQRSHALILDHKTGKNRGLDYYSKQFAVYAYLFKINFPTITHIIPAINWVLDGEVEMAKPIDVTDLDAQRNNILAILNKSTAKLGDLDMTTKSGLCGWCDFKPQCPEFGDASDVDRVQNQKEGNN